MRKVLVTLLSVLICCSAFSQVRIEGGIGWTNFKTDNSKCERNSAVQVRAVYELALSKRVQLETGIALSPHGGTENHLLKNDSLETRKYIIPSIEVPLVVSVKFNPVKHLQILPGIGGYYSYAVSGKEIINNFMNPGSSYILFKDDTTFKRSDAGLRAQLVCAYTMHVCDLLMSVGYNKGFMNMRTKGEEKMTNQMLSLSLGVRFHKIR